MKKKLLFTVLVAFPVICLTKGAFADGPPLTKAHLVKHSKKVSKSTTNSISNYLFTCPSPPSPARPNNGVVVGCSLGETISLISDTNFPGQGQTCYFHCGLEWAAPSGWLFTVGAGGPGERAGYSPFFGSFGKANDPMNIKVPSSNVNNGLVGNVTVTAYYSECSAPYNTSSSSPLWFGAASVANGKINGTPWGGGTYYVPGGYANLSVDVLGGTTANWYIAQGSGTINPSGSNCSVSFGTFVRVVTDGVNRCGSGGGYTFYLSSQQGYSGYTIGPNPASDQVSVNMEMKEMAGELIQSVELLDENQKVRAAVGSDKLKPGKYDKKSIDLDVKGLPKGTYFLHVKMKGSVERHQIYIQ